MEISLFIAVFLALFACAIKHGQAEYWRGIAEERGDADGWQDEALFWRKIYQDKEAKGILNSEVADDA